MTTIPEGEHDQRPAYFELRFRPNVELVSVVRRFVSAFYERIIHDLEVTERLAMVTHELLENAVKYSSDGETLLSIEVDQVGTPRNVLVRTKNRTTAENRSIVKERFQEANAAPDMFAYYQELMRRASTRTEGSGLGLGRIRSEADMSVDFAIEGEELTIDARTTISAVVAA